MEARRLDQQLLQPAHQPPDVVTPATIADLDRVAPGERLHFRRQVVAVGHLRAGDEHRDQVHVGALERRLDLESDEVLGIGDPNRALVVLHGRPARAHDHDQHMTGGHHIRDPLDEVDPGREIDIHEDVAVAELGGHRVVEAPGVRGGFLTPVADEDLRLGDARRPSAFRVHPSAPIRPPATSRFETQARFS